MNRLVVIFLFSVAGAFFLWIGARFHFFRLKKLPDEPLRLRFPIWGFLGYLIAFFVIAPLSIHFLGPTLKNMLAHSPPLLMTAIQFLAFFWAISFLIFYSIIQEREILKGVWLHKKRRHLSCVMEDIGIGIVAWIIAFPVVAAVGQLADFITYIITGKEAIQQLAIQFLLKVKYSPSLLTIALITILIAAPAIEEIVFRGFLYTFLRGKFGIGLGMISSSFLFAISHFSPHQEASNFPLVITLFFLALFLSFLYEKQRSLIAPIALHMTFNSISVIRILLISS